MKPYHKIQTLFKRDPTTNHRTLLMNEYAQPEFEYLKNNTWELTEKVDGTNIRVTIHSSGLVTFDGRTDNAQLPSKLFGRLRELFPCIGKLAKQFPDGGCLYGEGCGAGIQKGGGNYSSTQEFVLFDVQVGDWWLKRSGVMEVANALAIEAVPVVMEGTLADMVRLVRNGFTSAWGGFRAEGIVARPKVELLQRNGERIITKLKIKDFG